MSDLIDKDEAFKDVKIETITDVLKLKKPRYFGACSMVLGPAESIKNPNLSLTC